MDVFGITNFIALTGEPQVSTLFGVAIHDVPLINGGNMRKGSGSHHVVPSAGGGWDVKRGGASRSSGHFDTKAAAVDRGHEISRNAGTEFRIHNRDGKIASSDSHGNDPNPPRG